MSWAERLKRTFDDRWLIARQSAKQFASRTADISKYPLCGGTLHVIADITDPAVIDKILTHIRKSRAPPVRPQMQANKHAPNPYTSRAS
jgi:hypothetical protein|tara:strand:- start:506 stop:772 length:267 start_codon:yes stop_codon:yes gene_type:complete